MQSFATRRAVGQGLVALGCVESPAILGAPQARSLGLVLRADCSRTSATRSSTVGGVASPSASKRPTCCSPRSTERASPSRTTNPPDRYRLSWTPEQAALAAELLQAAHLVPIHYHGYTLPGLYEQVTDALKRLTSANSRITTLGLGESIET
jgi:hypothetical protein